VHPASAVILPVRPRLRGALHAVAAVLAAVAGVAITLRAGDSFSRGAGIAYGVTMTAMFAVSAGYHRGRWSPAARRRMKALDHTTIFCFIVGSYAPLAALVLGPRGRLAFLGSLVVVAAAGVVVKVRTLDRLGGPADVLYGVAAWWGLWTVVPAVHALSPPDLALALGGLVCYSLSAGVLGRRWWDPAPDTFGYHEVAHAVMLLGAICHYVVYWRGYG
jgi:hemolysin III